jgi:hyperosmotically inducible protein
MKPESWMCVTVLTLLIVAPAHASARAPVASQTVVEQTKEGAVKATAAVVKGAKVVADKTEDGLSKTGEVMTDGWITSRIHARFVDEALLKDSNISVETNDHVVTLTGTVMARAGRTRATRVARQTEGVRRVVNQLTIGPRREK